MKYCRVVVITALVLFIENNIKNINVLYESQRVTMQATASAAVEQKTTVNPKAEIISNLNLI